MTLRTPATGGIGRCSRRRASRSRPTSVTPAQPDHPARAIRCDANDHARPRKRLNQNTCPKHGVQVKLNEMHVKRLAARVGAFEPKPA
jgi:hypothetical protein